MPKINHYDAITGFYTHSTEAEQDPCEPSRWQVPAFSTFKSLLEPRDGLVNRYNSETKAFELVERPAPAQEQTAQQRMEPVPWMVDIAKRPAKIITEGTNFCNYVCMCNGFQDQVQLEAMAERFENGDTSALAERAHRFMAWRVECLGVVSDLAAGVRADVAVYPPSMGDMFNMLPKPPDMNEPQAGQEPAAQTAALPARQSNGQ